MSKSFKIFLAAFFISFPFFWGANALGQKTENFFFWHQVTTNPQLLAAQLNQERLEQELRYAKPFRNLQVEDLFLEAESSISVRLLEENEKVLFEKNSQLKLPIASLSKLMTGLVVLENYDLTEEIQISREAVSQEEEIGGFRAGERFNVLNLLYSMLMESSNDVAYGLADIIGQDSFINLMNLKAGDLGLADTHFVNSSGLTPDNLKGPYNWSTVRDLAKLTNYLLKNQPLIWQILSTSEFNLLNADGTLHHKVENTNGLLQEMPDIVGGKTGYTEEAGGCFVLVVRSPDSHGYIINILLASPAKFSEMRQLIDWLNSAYKW